MLEAITTILKAKVAVGPQMLNGIKDYARFRFVANETDDPRAEQHVNSIIELISLSNLNKNLDPVDKSVTVSSCVYYSP